ISATRPFDAMKSLTLDSFKSRCGKSDPGIAASASKNSSANAVRILVSQCQALRRAVLIFFIMWTVSYSLRLDQRHAVFDGPLTNPVDEICPCARDEQNSNDDHGDATDDLNDAGMLAHPFDTAHRAC